MSNQAAIPAATPYVSLKTGLRALPTVAKDHSIYDSPSSVAGPWPVRGASLSAHFISQERDESCVPARVFRSVSRLLFGHGFGAYPSPCGGSLFCFSSTALRVTVSLQILFGKYAAKISPEPP